jgi:5-methyltetrahydrofolate--homocysteine methyltransferase
VFKNFDLAELAQHIDWAPFFQTWDLAGPFPAILKDDVVGTEAVRVYADAQRMLKRLIEGRWLTANGVMALYPANSVGDDIEIYTDESRREVAMVWHGLRQQTEKTAVAGADGKLHMRPSRCLSDFVAPKTLNAETKAVRGGHAGAEGRNSFMLPDYIGLFAVTAGIGAEKKEKYFQDDHDDYSSIMLKALADRLAEAFAESLHQRVREDLWGYAANEALTPEELIAEKYRGIRPAPGYPACPDHSVKQAMFDLLKADEIGMALTESLAMTPAASVSGFYLSHPDSAYFNVGKIGDDQVHDLAKRRGVKVQALERLLAPNL